MRNAGAAWLAGCGGVALRERVLAAVRACNTSSCNFDGGDCANATSATMGSGWSSGSSGGSWGAGSSWGAALDYCAPGCPDSWIGDKYCDKPCQVPRSSSPSASPPIDGCPGKLGRGQLAVVAGGCVCVRVRVRACRGSPVVVSC
jgi:hypothetical protein